MANELIVSKAGNSGVSFETLDAVEAEAAQGERAIAVNVIAASEAKMRKRALVSTHGVPGYGTFEVSCDEGTPLGGDDSAPPPLAYLCVDTDESPDRVAELTGIVRQACMALQSLVQPVPADFGTYHNGNRLDQFPWRRSGTGHDRA